MKNNTTTFGYTNFDDLLNTNFGISSFKLNTLIALFACLTTFITNYVYDSPGAVYFMLFALATDAATGVWLALKNKRFSSARLPRILVTMVLYTLLLSLAWNAAKYNAIFYFLPSLIYGGLMSTILVSITENIYYLGYLPKSIFNILQQRLKLNKLFKLQDEQPKENETKNIQTKDDI